MKNITEALTKIKNIVTILSSNSITRYVSKENENDKDIRTLMFIVASFTKAKKWKQTKYLSMDEWIKEMQCIYTMEYTQP